MKQYRMDYHLHTLHSMDGKQTMDELCQSMIALGVQECCITEHIEPGHPVCDIPPIWDVWLREIREMQQKYPRLILRKGVEIGDNPLCRQETIRLLDSLPLDFRLLSLHLVRGVDCYDQEDYYGGRSRAAAYRDYAEAKAESITAWTDFDSVAHIGYVSRYSPYQGEEKPLYYQDAPDAFDTIFRHIIQHDKCLEINTSGFAAAGYPLPHPTLIRRYVELGGECFTFGSDSHQTDRNYADVERGKALVRELGGKYQAAFHQRQRTLYPL